MSTIGRTGGSEISHHPIPPLPIDKSAQLIWLNDFRAFPSLQHVLPCISRLRPISLRLAPHLSLHPYIPPPPSHSFAPFLFLSLSLSLSLSLPLSLSLSLSLFLSPSFSLSLSLPLSLSGFLFLSVCVPVSSRQPTLYLTFTKNKMTILKKK